MQTRLHEWKQLQEPVKNKAYKSKSFNLSVWDIYPIK